MKTSLTSTFLILFILVFITSACIEAVEPEFDYQNGLIFIDAFALSEKGLSQVSIKKSVALGDFGSFENVTGAKVHFESESLGIIENLSETSSGFYVTDEDFAVQPNETWKLVVQLADGRTYESSSERIKEAVVLEELKTTYFDELTFDPGFNDFVPGHKVTASFSDPPGMGNNYIWRMRTFEKLNTCLTCFNGIFRNGECIFQEIPRFLPQYHDYICFSDCWMIRYGSSVPAFSDQFVDGTRVEDQEIADVIFYRKENILIEIQQLSVTESSYNYYKTINDLVEESGGLNAPTPAALLGNIACTSNPEEIVIGNFTAAPVSTKRVFLERKQFNSPVDPDPFIHLESCIPCPRAYPCEEGENRTGVTPIGWEE